MTEPQEMTRERFAGEAEALLPQLYRIAQGILRQPSDAQDAVQQGLLRAWEKRETVRPASFRPWVIRIVINQCHDIQRRRMRMIPTAEFPEAPVYEPGFEPPDPALAAALFSLKENLRVPLLLRYMEGLDTGEIAAALGLPVSLVKNRLFRARRALQKRILESREEERVWENQ